MNNEMQVILVVIIGIALGTAIAILLAKLLKSLLIAIIAGIFICTVVTLAFGDGREIVSVVTSYMDEDIGEQIRDGYDHFKEKEQESFGSNSQSKLNQPKKTAQDTTTGLYYVSNVVQIGFKDNSDINDISKIIQSLGHSFMYHPDTKVYEIMVPEQNFQSLSGLCQELKEIDCIKSVSHQVFR